MRFRFKGNLYETSPFQKQSFRKDFVLVATAPKGHQKQGRPGLNSWLCLLLLWLNCGTQMGLSQIGIWNPTETLHSGYQLRQAQQNNSTSAKFTITAGEGKEPRKPSMHILRFYFGSPRIRMIPFQAMICLVAPRRARYKGT